MRVILVLRAVKGRLRLRRGEVLCNWILAGDVRLKFILVFCLLDDANVWIA